MQEEAGYACAHSAFEDGIMDGAAVIIPNDNAAMGLMKAARELGRQAGRDFFLVSFDNSIPSRSLDITSVSPPLEHMGEEAARLVLSALHNRKFDMQVILRSRLIPRGSSGSTNNAS